MAIIDLRLYKLQKHGYIRPNSKEEGKYNLTSAGILQLATLIEQQYIDYYQKQGKVPPQWTALSQAAYYEMWLRKYNGNPLALFMGLMAPKETQ